MKKISRVHSKRHMILLEVLIALTLIVMCAMPLIYPHIFLLQTQRKFVKTIELDHYVNLMYADVFQRMYTGEISWDQIQSKQEIPIDSAMWQRIHPEGNPKIALKGSYQFGVPLRKKSGPLWGAYVIPIFFTFASAEGAKEKTKSLKYEASVYVLRQLPAEEASKDVPEDSQKKDPDKENPKKPPKKKSPQSSEELAET